MTALLPESKIPNEEVQETVSEARCLLFKRKLGREDVNKCIPTLLQAEHAQCVHSRFPSFPWPDLYHNSHDKTKA